MIHSDVKIFKREKDGTLRHVQTVRKADLERRPMPVDRFEISIPKDHYPVDFRRCYKPKIDGTQ